MKINSQSEYNQIMKEIEEILQKSTKLGGFENLILEEREKLNELSAAAEKWEDHLKLFPLK